MNDLMSSQMNAVLMRASQGQDGAKLDALKAAAKNEQRIEDSAQEFEAMFVAEMMKPMFEGISTEAPFGGGKGEEIFRGLMLQEYGKMVAKSGGIGLSKHVREQMIAMQEIQEGRDPTTQILKEMERHDEEYRKAGEQFENTKHSDATERYTDGGEYGVVSDTMFANGLY